MADATIQLGYKNSAWFAANPTLVLSEGQHVYLSDGAGEFIEAYVIGDGVTELQNLAWRGLTNTLTEVIATDTDANNLLAVVALDRKPTQTTPVLTHYFNFFHNTTGTLLKTPFSSLLTLFRVTLDAAYTTTSAVATQITTALSGYLPIAATQTTGVALTFATDSVYGSIATPETGNIIFSTTGAQLGVTNIIIHNSGTEPTYSTMKRLTNSNNYVTGVVNYIIVTYINSTEVIYSISQRA